MSRLIWERRIALKRWNKRFTWIRSGSLSIATNRPYEIYEKRLGPDLLAEGPQNETVTQSIADDLQSVLGHRKFKDTHFIHGSLTAILGKKLTTQGRARRAYNRKSARTATVHTGRKRLRDLPRFFNDVRAQLDYLASLPSAPAWLVAIDVTVYFNKGDLASVKKSGNLRVTSEGKRA